MNFFSAVILCLSYVIGLLSTGVFAFSSTEPSGIQILIAVTGLIGLTTIAAIFVPRFLYVGKGLKLWLIAGAIAVLAVVYFQLRVPHPSVSDISQLVSQNENVSDLSVTVRGKIIDRPRLNRTQKIQFLLQAEQVSVHQKKKFTNSGFQKVTGTVYVTLPEEGKVGIYPDRRVYVTGKLYQPQSGLNPGAFDFKAYLARQGVFAGVKGKKISFAKGSEPLFALWKLQKRIVNAQKIGLGDNVGALLSSMVLGAKAVDIPYDLRDRFTRAGLAHVFAASGFQVSLLLGVAIAITKRFSKGIQLVFGLSVLFIYIGLTGVQPSILRAGLMGVGALIGIVMERKIKSLSCLLLSAVILLLFNPLWIWDLSFQLSFLATLGLVITASALQKRLDWMPSAIASLIAVPIAASVWTLPLLIYVFNTLATYSIPVNVIVTPLISIISLGGMLSSTAAIFIPVCGSAIAWLLYYPINLLIWLVEFFTNLPGSALAIGTIPLGVMLLLYGLMMLIWLNRWCQYRWWLISLLAIILITIPSGYFRLSLVRVTVLAAKNESVVVIQDRGKVVLINSGETDTARYTVIPFLAQQGINRIDRAVALSSNHNLSSGWYLIADNFAIDNFVSNLKTESIYLKLPKQNIQELSLGEKFSVGSTQINLINKEPVGLQFQTEAQTWLLLDRNSQSDRSNKSLNSFNNSKPQILLWTGNHLEKDYLNLLQPQIAIASSSQIDSETLEQIDRQNIKLYLTNRDGAIEWQPKQGIKKLGDREQENYSI